MKYKYMTPYWEAMLQSQGDVITNNYYFYCADTSIYLSPLVNEVGKKGKVSITYLNHDGRLQAFTTDEGLFSVLPQPFILDIPLNFGRTWKIITSDYFPKGGQYWGWGSCIVESEFPLLVSGETIIWTQPGIENWFDGVTSRTIPFTDISTLTLPGFANEDSNYKQPVFTNSREDIAKLP